MGIPACELGPPPSLSWELGVLPGVMLEGPGENQGYPLETELWGRPHTPSCTWPLLYLYWGSASAFSRPYLPEPRSSRCGPVTGNVCTA